MAAPPTVSVVMIFHDAGRFLDEAVRSVVAQTYPNWELILVDDGSADGSDAVAERWAASLPDRVRVVCHAGRRQLGTGPSRNLGIQEATARYFTELDADDVWHPEFLERHLAPLEADPSLRLAFSPVERWYSWSGAPDDRERDWVARPWDGLGDVVEPPQLLPIMLTQAPLGGVPKGVVVRREDVVSVGGYPDAFRDMYEDQALLAKLMLRCRAHVGTEPLYRYRRHDASMVTVMNRTRDRRRMRLGYLTWLEAYLAAEPGADRAVREALRSELWRSRNPRLDRVRTWAHDWRRRIGRRAGRLLGRAAIAR